MSLALLAVLILVWPPSAGRLAPPHQFLGIFALSPVLDFTLLLRLLVMKHRRGTECARAATSEEHAESSTRLGCSFAVGLFADSDGRAFLARPQQRSRSLFGRMSCRDLERIERNATRPRRLPGRPLRRVLLCVQIPGDPIDCSHSGCTCSARRACSASSGAGLQFRFRPSSRPPADSRASVRLTAQVFLRSV
jgi:hypothetical protein